MQAPTLTLSELVYGVPCTSLDPTDRALQIEEAIALQSETEAELERVRGELEEMQDMTDEVDKLRGVLKDLIEAIDGAKVGRVAKVGALIVVGMNQGADFADVLGDALKAAREAL